MKREKAGIYGIGMMPMLVDEQMGREVNMLNEKYSFKDFTHRKFADVDPAEFSNSEIVGSCFYQENQLDARVFPAGMTGVTFKRCNLDNVLIPVGNTVITEGRDRCCHRRLMVQNDLEDWFVDGTNRPIEPINKATFLELGLSVDPKNIPAVKMDEPITIKTRNELAVNE